MQLNNSKAKDIFGMDALFLKKYSAILISPLLHLINLSIKEGKFPHSYKMAIITPIYKSGALIDSSNYRPISILPAMSKVLEKVIANQLMIYLENNPFYHPKQFGFRKKCSTEMALCHFIERIKC